MSIRISCEGGLKLVVDCNKTLQNYCKTKKCNISKNNTRLFIPPQGLFLHLTLRFPSFYTLKSLKPEFCWTFFLRRNMLLFSDKNIIQSAVVLCIWSWAVFSSSYMRLVRLLYHASKITLNHTENTVTISPYWIKNVFIAKL